MRGLVEMCGPLVFQFPPLGPRFTHSPDRFADALAEFLIALPTPSGSAFYAVEVRPAIICWTGCGLRVDADLRVINQQEQAIPGLYAAGETVGSLHGDRYIGGGGSFGPCVTFGRLAGANAAAFARARS